VSVELGRKHDIFEIVPLGSISQHRALRPRAVTSKNNDGLPNARNIDATQYQLVESLLQRPTAISEPCAVDIVLLLFCNRTRPNAGYNSASPGRHWQVCRARPHPLFGLAEPSDTPGPSSSPPSPACF